MSLCGRVASVRESDISEKTIVISRSVVFEEVGSVGGSDVPAEVTCPAEVKTSPEVTCSGGSAAFLGLPD